MEYKKNISITEGGRKFSFGPVKRVQTKRQGSDEMAVWVPKDNFKLDDLTAYQDGEYTPEDYAFGTVEVRVSSAGTFPVRINIPDIGDVIAEIDDRLMDPVDPTLPGEPTVTGITDLDGNPIPVDEIPDGLYSGIDELGNPWNVDINGLDTSVVSGLPDGIGGSLVGTLNGANVMLSVNTNGDLVVDYPPDEIRVTVPPTKINYGNGEEIDYSGMVVTGYRNGVLWTDTKHPDGIIKRYELNLPEKTTHAEMDRVAITSELDCGVEKPIVLPNILTNLRTMDCYPYGPTNYREKGYYLYTLSNISNGYAVVTHEFPYGRNRGGMFYIHIYSDGEGLSFNTYQKTYSINMSTGKDSVEEIIDGHATEHYFEQSLHGIIYDKPIYITSHYIFFESDEKRYSEFYSYIESLSIEQNFPVFDKSEFTSEQWENLIYTIVYGEKMAYGVQELPIKYKLSKEKILETSTKINIHGEI
jgi:hypothetical protein